MNPLHKIFTIIETVVAKQDLGASYSDVYNDSGLPKSSVHRLLKDLTELGYIVYNPETKRYYGSLRLAALGAQVMSHFVLRDSVRPRLIALSKATRHAVHLGVLDGQMGVFVDKVEAEDYGIKLFSEIGKRFPLHCTAMGKVFLAFTENDIVEKVIDAGLKRVTNKTLTDPDRLKLQLEQIRDQGYAFDNEEITRGLVCVAAPLFGIGGKLEGAISVTFSAYVVQENGIELEVNAAKTYAGEISRSLGFSQA